MFGCPVCKQQHEMPKNGLPDNKIALKILSKATTQKAKSGSFDLLEKLLVQIIKKYWLIKHLIENNTDLVKENCINLRIDVRLQTENVIQQINDISSEIIDKIDKYEKEIIEFNQNDSKSLAEFNKIALELQSFHSLNIEHLKQKECDEKFLIKSNEEAICLMKKADLEIQKLKDFILDGKIFIFEKNSDKLSKSILGETKVIYTKMDSIILSGKDQIKALITLCDIPISKHYNLIYRASKDGFEASSFHSKCDKQLNTLVIIKSENDNIFGGYTEQDWTSTESFKNDKNFYVFSLINKRDTPLKLTSSEATKGIWCRSVRGPKFGLGPSFQISDNSNHNSESLSNLGITKTFFKHPYYADNLLEAQSFLAGTKNFKVLEIEAYTLE